VSEKTKHPPRVITRQTLAAGAAARWATQYWPGSAQCEPDKLEKFEKLEALGDAPTPEQVDAAIGNCYWTEMPACDCCGAEGEPMLLEMGQPADYGSRTLICCAQCLADAATHFSRSMFADSALLLAAVLK
jgi:hypothetical protein